MAHAAHNNDYRFFDASMRGPLVISGLFHLAIFMMTIVTLPFIIKPPPDISTPISVEIVEIDKITQTNKVAAPVEKIDKMDQPPPEPAKITPPEPVEETPPTPDIPLPAPPDIAKPNISELAPPEKEKPKDIVKPAPKKPPIKAKEKKKEEPKDFNSLLKDLTPTEKTQAEPQETLKDVLASATSESQLTPLGDRLTMSEIDALKHQLAQCWNVLSGAKYAEDLVVEVRVVVNPDRTVQQATIINQPLYNQDAYYKAAADAAIRALHNPRCSPLALPPDKYNEWKVTVIKFDPREML
jgi:hypothetical protein